MEKHWVKVCTTNQPPTAEVIRGMLEENGIRCVIVNKRDSFYLWGDVELYVPQDQVILAKHLINKPPA